MKKALMKKILCTGIGMGMAIALSACGGNSDMQEASSEPQATEQSAENTETPEVETENESWNSEEVMGKFLDMLGKTDDETTGIMEGEENVAADGALIGRSYEVELFGEKVSAGTLYDAQQRVTIVTMQLKNPDAGVYEKSLTELLGQPDDQSEAESETGSTWVSWNKDNKEIRLYQSFGIVSLEFQLLPDTSETENNDAGTFSQETFRIWGNISEVTEDRITVDNRSETGPSGEIVFHIDPKNTLILNAVDGFPVTLENVQPGSFEAYLGPVMTLSLPPQTTPLMVIVNIPADFRAPQFVTAAGAVKSGEEGMSLETKEGVSYRIAEDASIIPYLTRNMVRFEDIEEGSEILIWLNEEDVIEKAVLFAAK